MTSCPTTSPIKTADAISYHHIQMLRLRRAIGHLQYKLWDLKGKLRKWCSGQRDQEIRDEIEDWVISDRYPHCPTFTERKDHLIDVAISNIIAERQNLQRCIGELKSHKKSIRMHNQNLSKGNYYTDKI